MEQTAVNSLGFAHFLTQTDGVGQAVLGTLLLLSIASWYLIVTRALANTLAQRKAEEFLKRFWLASSLSDVDRLRSHELGCHAEVALVLPVFVVGDDDEPAPAVFLDRFRYGCHHGVPFSHLRASCVSTTKGS